MPRRLPSACALGAVACVGCVGRAAAAPARTGNLWDLTERLHVDLERTASSVCRP